MYGKGKLKINTRPSRYLIYGLVDPEDHALCYIGKTHKRRENRLEEHILAANEGATAPVHQWIRRLLKDGRKPKIFVIERVPGCSSWEEAEKRQIAWWREFPKEYLPYLYPPMTRKSKATLIEKVSILNVQDGG